MNVHLGKLVKIYISTDYHDILSDLESPIMHHALIAAIMDPFAREQGQRAVRSRRLTGFHDSARINFPSHWTMAMPQFSWDKMEPEVAGMMMAILGWPQPLFVKYSSMVFCQWAQGNTFRQLTSPCRWIVLACDECLMQHRVLYIS